MNGVKLLTGILGDSGIKLECVVEFSEECLVVDDDELEDGRMCAGASVDETVTGDGGDGQ